MNSPNINLNNFFKPGMPLPSDAVMIEKALEILELCPHGQQLVNFVQKKEITIRIIATPEPLTYVPDKKLVHIGLNRNNPGTPTRFILMLVSALREAQQEAAGVKMPPFSAPVSEHEKMSMSKHEDKVWYMCTVANELESQGIFTEYKFLDELRKMGHNELLELFMKERK